MEQFEIESIYRIFEKLSNNPYHTFSTSEYMKLDESFRETWLAERPIISFKCRECNATYPTPSSTDPLFLLCPECRVVTRFQECELKEFTFKIELLYSIYETAFCFQEGVARDQYAGQTRLGKFPLNGDEWQLVFCNVSPQFGMIMEMALHWPSQFHMFILINDHSFTTEQVSLLEQFGVYLVGWSECTPDRLQQIYLDQDSMLELRKSLQSQRVDADTTLMMRTLVRTATTAAGDAFEEQVYLHGKRVFDVIIPFGKNLKGFAIPDGLVTMSHGLPLPVMFYDCKSFEGDAFKHKAEIPMQAVYYQEFLRKLFSNPSLQNAGIIFFSSYFPQEVQEKIMNSAQWQQLAQNNRLYFIGVDTLTKTTSLHHLYGEVFDKRSFFELFFCGKTELFSDRKVKMAYEKQYLAQHHNFQFITSEQATVCFTNSLIEGIKTHHIDGLSSMIWPLKEAVEESRHLNYEKEVTNPVAFGILNDYVSSIKSKSSQNFLDPLSRYLLAVRLKSDVREKCGEKAYRDEMNNLVQTLGGNTYFQ